MVEETNNSNGDVQYKALDAAFLEAAYVNVAWKHEVQQSPDVIAAAAALAEQHPVEKTITADDIAGIVASVKQNCQLAGVPTAEIEKILAHIASNIGAPKSHLDEVLKDAQARAGEAISTAKGELVQNSMYNEAQYQQLWNEIKAIDKKIDKNIDELHAEGLISDEEYEKLKAERKRLDAMDNHDPKYIAGQKLYAQHLRTIYDRAEDNATTDKQQDLVKEGSGLLDKREERVNMAEREITAYKKAGEQSTYTTITAPATEQKNAPAQQTSSVMNNDKLTAEMLNAGATLNTMQMADASAPEAAANTPPAAPAKTRRSMG